MNGHIKRSAWGAAMLLACLMPGLSVQAASFDCGKAQTSVEHLICDNPEISKLDEEMAAKYKAVLKDNAQAKAVRQAQRQWLKERNRCEDVACIKQIFEVRLSALLDEEMGQKYKSAMQDKAKAQQVRQQQQIWIAQRNDCKDVTCIKHICEIRLSELKRLLTVPPEPNTKYVMNHGKGQAICEQVIKQMNEGPPLCALDLLATIPGVELPKWKKLDWQKNKLLYERFLLAQMVREEYYPQLFGGPGNDADAIPIPSKEQLAKGWDYVLWDGSSAPLTIERLEQEWEGAVKYGNEFYQWDGAVPDETDVILVETRINRNLGGCPAVRLVPFSSDMRMPKFSADMNIPKPWFPRNSGWGIYPGQFPFKFDDQYYSLFEESGLSRDGEGTLAIPFRTVTIDTTHHGHYCFIQTNHSYQPQ
jgi:uncharacterized protein